MWCLSFSLIFKCKRTQSIAFGEINANKSDKKQVKIVKQFGFTLICEGINITQVSVRVIHMVEIAL